jgi:glycosyltransferase involved in cell wall biosynthesis
VVIPTFGRAGLLSEAVGSVLEQSVGSLECLVVDDGGGALVDLPDDPRVRVIRRPINGGSAAARNTGLGAARGRYVAFLDDDDLFTVDRLGYALAGLETADLAVCWARWLDGPSRPGRVLNGDVRNVVLEGLVPQVGQIAVRRAVVPCFDERLRSGEDVEWWIRASQQLKVATVPAWGLLYRRHSGPRHRKSAADRAKAREEILGWHAEFFAPRPRTRAFQWKRIGRLWMAAGERRRARRAFRRSLRVSPSIRTLWHLVRTLRRLEPAERPS